MNPVRINPLNDLKKSEKMRYKLPAFGIMLIMVCIVAFSCKKDESPPGPVTDIDGTIYKTIKIGEQIWMAENLKTTRYNDGTEIALISDAAVWNNTTSGGYCWYMNDKSSFGDIYGAIYNGYTINTAIVCPVGWHVPDREEWQKLRNFTGDSLKAGGKLKEAGTEHWLAPNKGADNSSGFTALASGMRYFDGSFASVLYFTGIWSSTETGEKDLLYMSLNYGDATFSISNIKRNQGFSIRCIKDDL